MLATSEQHRCDPLCSLCLLFLPLPAVWVSFAPDQRSLLDKCQRGLHVRRLLRHQGHDLTSRFETCLAHYHSPRSPGHAPCRAPVSGAIRRCCSVCVGPLSAGQHGFKAEIHDLRWSRLSTNCKSETILNSHNPLPQVRTNYNFGVSQSPPSAAETVTTGRMSTGRLGLLCTVRKSDVAPPRNRARTKKAGKYRDRASATLKNNVRTEYVFSLRDSYQRREHLTASREVGCYADHDPVSNVRNQMTVIASYLTEKPRQVRGIFADADAVARRKVR